jgi:hypothetical protein
MNQPPPPSRVSREQELTRHFHRHVLADVDYLKTRGYNPSRFLSMIAQYGNAMIVAKRILSDPRHTTYGFERLWEMGELGRSVEFVANLPWFRALFTEDELDKAKSRLTLHNFPVEERLAVVAAHPPDWSQDM